MLARPSRWGPASHRTDPLSARQASHGDARIDRALVVNPASSEAHSNLGLALLDLKRPEEALASHDRSLKLRPDVPDSLNNRGNALQALNRPSEALADYDRALQLRPDFVLAHANRGNALRALGRLEEAVAAFDRALQLAPDFDAALNNRGRTLRDLGAEAAKSFARLATVAPHQPYAAGMLLDTRPQLLRLDGLRDCVGRRRRGSRARRACRRALRSCATPCHRWRSCAAQALHRLRMPALAATTGPSGNGAPAHPLAYLSADFHSHATAYRGQVFERHDRAGSRLVGFSYGPTTRARCERLPASIASSTCARPETGTSPS